MACSIAQVRLRRTGISRSDVSAFAGIAYMDVGEGREHMYRMYGSSAMQEQLPRSGSLTELRVFANNFSEETNFRESPMNYRTIQVEPVTPAIGAIVSGVDISTDLAAETIDEIRAAFHRHLVVFFRDQSLTPDQLLTFARRFGEIAYYPFVEGMAEHPEVVEVVKKENETINFGGLWHTDTSYLERPPLGSILYALEVPPIGGDTLFANMYLAYESLSSGMQQSLADLRGINSAEKPDAAITRVNRIAERPKDAAGIATVATHPIVRNHPDTGRKALYCSNAHTLAIEGMTTEESRPLLEYLYRVQQREIFTCRFRWQSGSVAFWDNRAAQHNALNDYHGHRRIMHRVTLKGEVPV